MKSHLSKNIVIAAILFVLILVASFFICSDLTPLGAGNKTDYYSRAAYYKDLNSSFFLWITIPLIVFCMILGLHRDSSKSMAKFTSKFNRLPDSVFSWGLPIIFFVAAASTSWWIIKATPRVLDGFNFWFQAQNFARFQVYAKEPVLSKFFQFPFLIIRDGKWYGSVYPGYPLLMAPFAKAGLDWLVNPALGALGIHLLWRFGRELYSETIGRWAAILALISPFYRMMSSIYMSHVSALLGVLVAIYALMRWRKLGRNCGWGTVLSAGSALAFIYITRPQAGAAVLPPFLVLWLFGIKRYRLRHLVILILPVLIGVAFLGYYNLCLTGSPTINPRYFVDPGRRLGFGTDIGEPLANGLRGGHSLAKGFHNVSILLNLLNSDLLGLGAIGPFGIVSILLILGILLPDRRAMDFLCFAAIFMNLSLYLFYFTSSGNFGPRYLTEVVPLVLFLLIRGVQKIIIYLPATGRGINKGSVCLAVIFVLTTCSICHLPIHTYHYGNLPETLDKSIIPPVPTKPAIIIIEPQTYKLNVFTWNSPDLDGTVYIQAPGVEALSNLKKNYPDYTFYRLRSGGVDRVNRSKLHWKLEPA